MKKKLFLGCGIPVIVVILLLTIGIKTILKPKPKPEQTETAAIGDVEIKVVEIGTIEPLKKTDIKSKVGGRVSRLLVDEGAIVKEGQQVAAIDPQEIDSQVAALRAQLAAAKARFSSANHNSDYQQSQTSTGIDQYEQNLKSAEARLRLASAEAKVQPELTRQNIDIASANLTSARSNLKALKDSFDLLKESTHPQAEVSAQTAYDQANAQLDNAERNLKRQNQLLIKGFVSQAVVDSASTDRDVASAHLRDVKQRLDRIKQTNAFEEANLKSQIASADGTVHQMESILAQAKSSVLPITKLNELESARAAVMQAKAQLAASRSGKTQNMMRKDEAQAAEADMKQIQNQLDVSLVQQRDTTLRASMNGMITKRYVEQGDLITSAISSFSSGSPVFQISDMETMLVKIEINEVDIAKVKPGLLAEITIDAARGVTFVGKVRKVAPAATISATSSSGSSSSSSSSSQSVIKFSVEVQVDHADPRLKPGLSAHCSIIVARKKNVLRIPVSCIQGDGEKATVQIVTKTQKDGQSVDVVTPKSVTVGLRGDDFAEVLSGLSAGDRLKPNAFTGPPRKTIEMRGGPD